MDRLIVGLMGEAKTGKDTIANMLGETYGFHKTAFAHNLKEACRLLFNFSDAQLYGNQKEVVDAFWKKTPREVLQYVGTELFRNNFDKDFWVKSLMNHINSHICAHNVQRWVISDCRFKNEMQAIKDAGGKVIRLYRTDGPGAENGIVGHPSEMEMKTISDSEFDAVISLPTGVPELLMAAKAVVGDWL